MRKILSIFFALLILTTNVGTTFAIHYCGGKAVKSSISFGQDVLSCGMTSDNQSCENNSQLPTVQTKNCCENHYIQLKVNGDYSMPAIIKSHIDFNFVVDFADMSSKLYSYNASTEVNYLNCSPPLLNLDIPVWIQSFLI